MAILNIKQNVTGLAGIQPELIYIETNDTLATVTTTGYLNHASQQGYGVFNNNQMAMVKTSDTDTVLLQVVVTGTNKSLVAGDSSGGVILPSIPNHIAIYTNTTGTLSQDAATAINGGNIQAGLSGTAGYLASFPATAATGSLRLFATANSGNTLTSITNAPMGQASAFTIADPGTATANFAVVPAALVSGNLIKASGTAGLIQDAGIIAANVLVTTAAQQMAAGGVIKLDKGTATTTGGAATVNKQVAILTTETLSTAAGGSYVITFTNSVIATTSAILVSLNGGTNSGTKSIAISAIPGSGSATITITNTDAVAALSGTLILAVAVF